MFDQDTMLRRKTSPGNQKGMSCRKRGLSCKKGHRPAIYRVPGIGRRWQGCIFIPMPTAMTKSELLASWVYRYGELARQRLTEKTAAIALVAGLVLLIFPVFSLFFWDTVFFKRTAVWIIVILFLLFMALVYAALNFFSGLLYSIASKFVPAREEEVIITSAKIITEKKTWILNDEKKELQSVKWGTAKKRAELVFRGVEKEPGRPGRNYVVKLPVPPGEYRNGEKIYDYFRQLTGAVSDRHISG